jgi:uncharacterized membrane protein
MVLVLPISAQVTNQPRAAQAVIMTVKETGKGQPPYFFVFTARTDLDETFRVETKNSYPGGLFVALKEGDRVMLRIVEMPDGAQQIFFDDNVRTPMILVLFLLFGALAIVVGFFRGLFSLIGLGFTLLVLFGFLFPNILAGRDPILFTVLASVVILAINIHLSHGFRLRTFLSFLGTVCGLGFLVLTSVFFTKFTSLSGLGTEEASLLLWEIDLLKDPVGIFIAAVILGAVGALDDVAVSQSEIVGELQEANPELGRKDLFFRAMRVGQHHIASIINTLVLVYAGAALPMFLLFFSSSSDVSMFLNNESVGEEIVRILAGTIALILTVPLSTFFATFAVDRK